MSEVAFVSGAIDAGDCVSRAWGLVSRRMGLYIGIALVAFVLLGCIPFANALLIGPMMGGFYYIVLRDLRDEDVEFGMLFKGFEKFLPLMVVGLIQSAPGLVLTVVQYAMEFMRLASGSSRGRGDIDFYQSSGSALDTGLSMAFLIFVIIMVVVGMVWAIVLTFAVPLVMEQNLRVGEALMTSAKAAFGNLGGLILLIILNAMVALLGLLAICVGLIVAIPVIYGANAVAYRYVFPYVDRQNDNMAPPPPTAYGSGTYGTGYGNS